MILPCCLCVWASPTNCYVSYAVRVVSFVLNAVRVVSKEYMQLVLPRTSCYCTVFIIEIILLYSDKNKWLSSM
jgi:hypothetical protein